MAETEAPDGGVIAGLLDGIETSTLVLGSALALVVMYALYRTMSGSAAEISRGKIARFLQFLQDLKWRIDRLKLRDPDSDVLMAAQAQLTALREAAESERREADWNGAYRLERHLIEFFTDEDLDEINYDYARNLAQAQGMGLAELAVYEGMVEESDPGKKKLALSKLVSDMQWARAEAYAKRKVAVAFVSRTGFLMLLSGLAAGMFLYLDPPFIDPGGFSGLDFAVVSGAFGASFFMLARSQEALRISTYSEIRRSLDWPLLLIRLAFGAAAAAAMYFFFETELVRGQLMPTLKDISYDTLTVLKNGQEVEVTVVVAESDADGPRVPNRHMALLFFWSFLAGFSERLVPSLLRGKSDEVRAIKTG